MNRIIACVTITMAVATLCTAQSDTKIDKKKAEAELIANENKFWDAVQKKDAALFQSLVAEDARYVSPNGLIGKQQAIQNLDTCTMNSFSVGGFQILWAGAETAIVNYSAKVDAVCGSDAVTSPLAVTTVWVYRAGSWVAFFHQETPMKQYVGAGSGD
ncbi:MAG: nuclear transport factor 2 family protein [Acidobacteriota bacterium]|nr:nuclear transport factor 2 family protein [Acidobacteriota bacterium]